MGSAFAIFEGGDNICVLFLLQHFGIVFCTASVFYGESCYFFEYLPSGAAFLVLLIFVIYEGGELLLLCYLQRNRRSSDLIPGW